MTKPYAHTRQFYNKAEVVYLSTRASTIKPRDQGLAPSDRSDGSWANSLHAAMAAAASTPQVETDVYACMCVCVCLHWCMHTYWLVM